MSIAVTNVLGIMKKYFLGTTVDGLPRDFDNLLIHKLFSVFIWPNN
jgi:hypothetical protein